MLDLNITFFIQLVNFLIALFVVNLFIIKPIREIVKKRKAIFAEMSSDAEKVNKKSSDRMGSYTASLDSSKETGSELKNKLKHEALNEERTIISAAQQEAVSYLQTTKSDINLEADKAKHELSSHVDALAARITAKILA